MYPKISPFIDLLCRIPIGKNKVVYDLIFPLIKKFYRFIKYRRDVSMRNSNIQSQLGLPKVATHLMRLSIKILIFLITKRNVLATKVEYTKEGRGLGLDRLSENMCKCHFFVYCWAGYFRLSFLSRKYTCQELCLLHSLWSECRCSCMFFLKCQTMETTTLKNGKGISIFNDRYIWILVVISLSVRIYLSFFTCVIKNTFGYSGFTRINMRNNTNISV